MRQVLNSCTHRLKSLVDTLLVRNIDYRFIPQKFISCDIERETRIYDTSKQIFFGYMLHWIFFANVACNSRPPAAFRDQDMKIPIDMPKGMCSVVLPKCHYVI